MLKIGTTYVNKENITYLTYNKRTSGYAYTRYEITFLIKGDNNYHVEVINEEDFKILTDKLGDGSNAKNQG